MKISNKILIGFLSTIFIVMAAMFLHVRVFGERKSERFKVSKTENLPIGEFSHVQIDNIESLQISPSETNHIHFIAYNDTTKIGIKYTIENDTLKIADDEPSSRSSYVLYAKSKIESITVANCNIRITGINQDSIQLKVTDGEINSFGSNENEFSHFRMAKITELNSRINFHNIKVDMLEIQLNNSNAGFSKDIEMVQASIKSKSTLNLKDVEKLELEKDENSRIYLR